MKNETTKTELEKGCGCWLFAKWFSVLNEVNKCPLNQWENFE